MNFSFAKGVIMSLPWATSASKPAQALQGTQRKVTKIALHESVDLTGVYLIFDVVEGEAVFARVVTGKGVF